MAVTQNYERSLALGRRNYLFAGSNKGAERAAVIYSILQTAKANGIEPYAYLKHLMEKLPITKDRELDTLLPWNVQLG